MSTKPFPAPGQLWMFAGSDLAPPSGPHTIKNLRWFYGETEAVFEDGSVASIRWMMELNAWQHVDARPDDMAELARLVAKELRRLPYAKHAHELIDITGTFAPAVQFPSLNSAARLAFETVPICAPRFANLTPREIADVIQSEEAKRAAEWAGEK